MNEVKPVQYCDKCKGTGWVHTTFQGVPMAKHCKDCSGTGKVTNTEKEL